MVTEMRVFTLMFNSGGSNLNTDTVATRIITIRGEQSRRAFARALEIKENTLRNYEQGLSLPNFDTVSKICTLFSVSPAWLILGQGEMRTADGDDFSMGDNSATLGAMKSEELLSRFAKLEAKLERVEDERRDVSAENRLLHKDKERLMNEIAELKAEVATLNERLKAEGRGGTAEVSKTITSKTA